jgi:uncharacterized protein YjdB
MMNGSSRRALMKAVVVLLPAILLVLAVTACQDAGNSGPLTNDPVPAKGVFLELNPAVAELVETGDQVRLTASVRDVTGKPVVNARVLFESMDPTVATVDVGGTVTGVGEGVAEIVGKSGTATATTVVAVARRRLRDNGDKKSSVTVYPASDTVPLVGSSVKFLAVARTSNSDLVSGSKLTWQTNDQTVATIDDRGIVTGKRSGTTKVIVRYNDVADTADLRVAPPGVAVAVRVTPDADTIPQIGGTAQLSGAVLNGSLQPIAGVSPEWKSLDPTLAAVTEGGKVTGGVKGVARIVAYYGALSDTAKVWIAPAPSATSLFVTPAVDTIPVVGGTASLSATLIDGSGNPVTGVKATWGTLDPAIATVDTGGVVKGLSKGTARITARLNTLVDTALVLVAPGGTPTPPYRVVITPPADTIATGESVALNGQVFDKNNSTFPNILPTWSSLDVTVATVSTGSTASASTTIHGLAKGTARILAKYGTAVDTATILVTTGTSTGTGLTLTPNADTLAVGDTVRLSATVRSATGTVTNVLYCFESSNPSIADVGDGGLVQGRALGTAKISCESGLLSDTATIWVTNASSGGGSTGKPTIEINPAVDTIPTVGGSLPLSATVRDAQGILVSNPTIAWTSLDAGTLSVSSSAVVTGLAKGFGRIRAVFGTVADTAFVWVAPGIVPVPGGGASITPHNLRVALGPLVARNPNPTSLELRNFDSGYMTTEVLRFLDWVALENDPSGIWLDGNHYGSLRSRLSWAIRTGQPYGPGVTDESRFAYARGRRILKKYLQYSKANSFAVQAHHNTGLADVEALYVLEGDMDAYNHIHVTAIGVTTDRYNYLKLQNPGSDARQIAVAIQAATTAHRLGIPYKASPLNTQFYLDPGPGSWKAVAQRQIQWLTQYNGVKADGSIPSPAHGGAEAFLFNAWLARELLLYCAHIEWNQGTFDLARRIVDHMVTAYNTKYLTRGWSTLPYTSASTGPAPDLAAFYVWPALALWQETGDSKYYDFAMVNLAATKDAYIAKFKQWNQVYSTMAEGAEALMMGARWR